MNILVTGANGQLGREIRDRSGALSDNFIFTDVNGIPGCDTVYLDITNRDAISIIVESERIDAIVNCAAYTDVDKAEKDVVLAKMLNTDAVANLAAVAKKHGVTLVHVSTDYVFSGEGNTPIRECDAPDPRSVYGSTKLSGELAIASSGCNSIILRTAWLYSPYGKNFVKTMRELTSSRDSVKVVFDQVGSPTYAGDLADAILHIIETGQLSKSGIYHFTDEGAVSWFDFAQEICALSGNECEIIPCLSSEFESKVRRPAFSVLDKTLFKKTFAFRIPYWKESLKKCISRL